MLPPVYLSAPLPRDSLERLAGYCEPRVAPGGQGLDAASAPADIGAYRGLICLLTDRIDSRLLDVMPDLSFVSSISVGVDHVDVDALSARGGIVDKSALAQALDEERLFAAGLDVFEHEPPPADHPLLRHPRTVLTPHIGSATAHTRGAMVERAVDNVLAALQGGSMPYCVNPQVYNA